MADSDKLRQRRRRAHFRNDHTLCKPRHCAALAGTVTEDDLTPTQRCLRNDHTRCFAVECTRARNECEGQLRLLPSVETLTSGAADAVEGWLDIVPVEFADGDPRYEIASLAESLATLIDNGNDEPANLVRDMLEYLWVNTTFPLANESSPGDRIAARRYSRLAADYILPRE